MKYGITVTELRRANQLWASDSVHLRQVLYIPLDKARHASLETVASLLAQRADSDDDEEEDIAHPTAAASHHSRSRSLSDPDADRPSVVRRIPLTSLSFFPPPSSKSSALAGGLFPRPASTPHPSHVPPPAAANTTMLSKGSTLTSTLRASALSSFFSALPINASTRDEIFSRLSIDSVSNSTTASDEAVEHELTPVPTTPKRKPLRTDDAAPVSMPSTSRRKNRARHHTWLSESRYGEEGRDDVEHIALASTPIHTTQMQPAAAMQLPGSMMRSSAPKEAPLADSLNGVWRSPSDHHPQTR